MAEEKKQQTLKNPAINHQAKPTTLDKSVKLDIDTTKVLADNIIEAGLTGGLEVGALEKFTSISNSRDQIYQLIDTMANDSAVSSIIKTYADVACEMADNGHLVWCESNDPKVSKYVNYLLNVMNVDKNIYSWIYSLAKYGDVYLRLYRESDYDDGLFKKDHIDKVNSRLNEDVKLNMHTTNDAYSYYVEAVADPSSMFELTKFGKTYGYIEVPVDDQGLSYLDNYLISNTTATANYKMRSNDVNVYQADDFVHMCLVDNTSRFPEKVEIFKDENGSTDNKSTAYTVKRGKSLLFDNYKIWREKSLLENAILLNRITRSSVVRTIQVEVGDMPKEQVSQTLRRVKDLMEQKSAINTGSSMAEYNNPGPVENNIYLATHSGQGALTIGTIGGDVDVKNLADLDSWVNKFYSGFGVPKAYFGYTDDGAGFNGGTSLSIISSVFAKGVKQLQNAAIQAISDAINLILINKGFRSYLNNFTIKMKAPLTQEEKDYREDLGNRINAISNFNALLADVEDKERRLEILKSLISTLNYGDNILTQIDLEIEAVRKKKKEDEEAAKAEGAENAPVEEATEESGGEDLELPPIETESFTNNGGQTVLVEENEFLSEEDHLPTPEEANDDIDFTQNN